MVTESLDCFCWNTIFLYSIARNLCRLWLLYNKTKFCHFEWKTGTCSLNQQKRFDTLAYSVWGRVTDFWKQVHKALRGITFLSHIVVSGVETGTVWHLSPEEKPIVLSEMSQFSVGGNWLAVRLLTQHNK